MGQRVVWNSSFNFGFCFVSSVVTMVHNVGNVLLWSSCVKLWLYIRVFFKVTLVFTMSLGLLSPPYPLFGWGPQSKEVWFFNLGMKCWNSAFNAQSSRVTIVVVQVGSVKIYAAAAVEARSGQRKERSQNRMKLSLPQKMMHFWVSPPCILYICWEPIVNLMGTWWEQQKSNTSRDDGLALLTSSYMISCVQIPCPMCVPTFPESMHDGCII